ncbi:MAG: hypothetical protein AB7O71_04195, partial [Hyphomicrobiaceae bacterium]
GRGAYPRRHFSIDHAAIVRPGPQGARSTGNPVFNAMWTYLGVPCVTLPLMTVGGMPCGVQLIGKRRDEGRLLAVARWVEEKVAERGVMR